MYYQKFLPFTFCTVNTLLHHSITLPNLQIQN